ncbi:glycoside hydrolase, putative [Phytophthora infestans T30-4]|uniref:Glycoside hydrolase, putative n=1 Tax=Phytophthora infestans (strain T30-4) TaxID=403677 RepID=D0NXN3_PHYIT|nr:glycoside hydrolase, putative [Phytophthora infestans T30-4]EEY67833.1 glycoside hydrolase, putative [Phytophthora infestans T30-4]|eukprot:XP_002997858.1 glycoside hydrolase, putative [Phytophthora infestans T30-4]
MSKDLKFPEDFMWGTATASYQVEGASNEGGRGDSIWDAFSRTPGKIVNGDTGEKAVGHYHRYKEDVQLMKKMGLKAYRLSIAWPRIIPAGVGAVNEEGVEFYNNLINELLANDITPLRFGDRVTNWLTLNEPWCSAFLGYGNGVHAPGRKWKPHTEVYFAGHNLLLAHARAVEAYRNEFQATQKATDDPVQKAKNEEAAERSLLFFLGWFADPVYKGDYPQVMKDRCGLRLPTFTEDEKKLLKGSSDFFDEYEAKIAPPDDATGGYGLDEGTKLTSDDSWKRTDMGWNAVGWSFQKLLVWIQKRYAVSNGILVTENGCAWPDRTKEEAQNDDFRVQFYKEYLTGLHNAIAEGADVRGYFAWSFIDNYEWAEGYTKRFGLHWVNYETMERTPKKSALWYGDVIRNNGFAA